MKFTRSSLKFTDGDSSPSFSTIKKWAAEFKRGRTSLEDYPCEGRPKDATTPEIIEQVHDMVLDDRRMKVRSYRCQKLRLILYLALGVPMHIRQFSVYRGLDLVNPFLGSSSNHINCSTSPCRIWVCLKFRHLTRVNSHSNRVFLTLKSPN